MRDGFLKIGAIIAGIISIIYIMKKDTRSRGLRNNNPFNLKENNVAWMGAITDKDEVFEGFVSLDLGIRAGLVNLYNGYFSQGLTLRKIIAKYAPGSDGNDEKSYVDTVSRRSGVIPELTPGKSKWLSIASAMLYVENGVEVASPDRLRSLCINYNLINYI